MEEATLKKAIELHKKREELLKDKEQYQHVRNKISVTSKVHTCNECFRQKECNTCFKRCRATSISFYIDGTQYMQNICPDAFEDLISFAIKKLDTEINDINEQIKAL